MRRGQVGPGVLWQIRVRQAGQVMVRPGPEGHGTAGKAGSGMVRFGWAR